MSNLKFRYDVNDHTTAAKLHANGVERLAYNTWLVKGGDDYEIVHHSTPIITFHPDGSATLNARWVSRTTANRLHHYKPTMVERVNSHIARDGAWYGITLKNHPGTFEIEQGQRVRIYQDATVTVV